ncbi:hypothetical protein AKJ52_00635, partial [candidate division MSBL1 archaeon SCGC-AAA382C18]
LDPAKAYDIYKNIPLNFLYFWSKLIGSKYLYISPIELQISYKLFMNSKKDFEELTLKMKHSVIENHQLVWTRNRGNLEEYFYKYRKLWQDQAKARGIA